jgi:hypothetical protein
VGEDFDQFDLYREHIRAELVPVGLVESLLAERIVGLSWRLQRAERFHTEAFDTLYMKLDSDPRAHPAAVGPDRGDPIFGGVVVRDFSQTRVLERLMMYERRIEGSLYRTMAELRKRQGQRQSAGGGPLGDSRPRLSREGEDRREPSHRVRETLPADFTLDNLLGAIAALEEPPAGGTTNAPTAEGQLCETKPICGSPRGTGILPVVQNHGQDAHATITRDGVTASASADLSCETNPIPGGAGWGGANRTKQSQFAPRHVARASLRLRSQGRLCPWSKIMGKMPMPRYRLTAARRTWRWLRAERAKQTQFAAVPAKSKVFAAQELGAIRLPARPAKQSQFPPVRIKGTLVTDPFFAGADEGQEDRLTVASWQFPVD